MNNLWQTFTSIVSKTILSPTSTFNYNSFMPKRCLHILRRHQDNMKALENPPPPRKPNILNGQPFAKGVVLKTLIKKPRKPNSANRKCVLLKLSTGKEMVAYVPGIGHNLQEHQTVLVRIAKLKDTPGVKLKCVRGKYDLPHIKKPNK